MPAVHVTLDRERLEQLLLGTVVVPRPAAVFSVAGPGVLECLQGLLTNDVVGPGSGTLVYGAMLTPKGMILYDCWICRGQGAFYLLVPLEARATALELFQRTLPPRLATVEDLSDRWSVAWVYGARASAMLAQTTGKFPGAAGHVVELGDHGDLVVARGTPTAPFSGFLLGEVAAVERVARQLEEHGADRGDEDAFHGARILAGWPALGAEIGEKTLPQEVRFDEIGGVSYTKGCYIGQETVARVHFRGHTNRWLAGLVWDEVPAPAESAILFGDKDAGEVHSVLTLPDRVVGLGHVRRRYGIGETLLAGGAAARLTPLPFDPTDLAA